ncbi:MAG: sugar ABC transporter permease, partial [Kibdelosporangium sp.]
MTVVRPVDPPPAAVAVPRVHPPRGTARRRREHQPEAYVFLAPWIIGAIGLTVGPMVVSLYLSFTDYDLFTPPTWVGLDNFVRMFAEDDRYLRSVQVTLVYVLVAVPLKLIASLLVAMVLNTRAASNGFYRAAFYAPSLLGASVAAALVWRALFTEGGPVNELLDGLGWETPSWVDDPGYT